MKNILPIILLLLLLPTALVGDEPSRDQLDFFESKIRPVLIEHCYSCHSAEAQSKGKLKGGLLLDTKQGWDLGGDTGPSIVPNDPAAGSLMLALSYEHDVQMPPAGKLPEEIIKNFERWIREGAVDPRIDSEPMLDNKPKLDPNQAKEYWAFQAPKESPAPPSKYEASTKIDSFILAQLEAKQLTPASLAEPRVLIRRLYLDLIGLPPSVDQVNQFVNDPSEANYATIVEQLLASPAYGERWARLWLDVTRYAEDQAHIVGDDKSLTYPNAYLYRDWVIQALNNDISYSDFISLQLAADLIEGENSPNLAALGFIGLGPKYYDRGQLFVMAEEWEDRVDVVGRGLLGLTIACARCHDHKYDPIPTQDYYGLAGVFASTQMYNKPLFTPDGSDQDKTPSPSSEQTAKETAKPKSETKPNGEAKNPAEAMHIVREDKPRDLNVFVRGDVNHKGDLVPRRFPSVLTTESLPFLEGSGRRELADAIADPSNPLTARVIVNRVWGAYFGKGLVGTPSNFGTLGERPTHPELLDDLAARFVREGSSLKWLQREIVHSRTYRQSSIGAQDSLAADPNNQWLARMPRRRLSAESWRDSLLSVSGQLNVSTVGGPSIDPSDTNQTKRTVYSRISRLELHRFLAMHDFPDPNVTAEKRAETITPLQKLFVMNSAFMLAQSQAFVERLRREIPDDAQSSDILRINLAYQRLYSRPPTTGEIDLAAQYLSNGDRNARWLSYVHALLAANEMLYVD